MFNRSGGRSAGATTWTAYWLYNRTGDAFLLDLADKIHAGSADYTSGIPTWHNVNIAQGFREPAQYAAESDVQHRRPRTGTTPP